MQHTLPATRLVALAGSLPGDPAAACLVSPLVHSQLAALSVPLTPVAGEGLHCLPAPAKAMQGIASRNPLSHLSQVNNRTLALGWPLVCLSHGSIVLTFLRQAREEPSLH